MCLHDEARLILGWINPPRGPGCPRSRRFCETWEPPSAVAQEGQPLGLATFMWRPLPEAMK